MCEFKKYSGIFAVWQADEIRGNEAFTRFVNYVKYFKNEILVHISQ